MWVDKKIIEAAQFDPGIAGWKTGFDFKEAKLDKDFMWTITLSFKKLPEKISMRYNLIFFLNPEPTIAGLNSTLERLNDNQLKLGQDVEKLDREAKDKIIELKKQYDISSRESGVHTFPVSVMEYKNASSGQQIKFLTSLESVKKIYKLRMDGHLEYMIAALEVIEEEDDNEEDV